MDYLQTLIGALIGGGLVGFIEFLIRRADEKKDKNSEIMASLKAITNKITGIEERMDTENANDARRRILSFDDELRRGIDHSEESFNQILMDVKYYKNYCREHEDYENDKAVSAISHVKDTYQRVKNENKFI